LKKASRWDCTSTPRRRNQAQETVKEEKNVFLYFSRSGAHRTEKIVFPACFTVLPQRFHLPPQEVNAFVKTSLIVFGTSDK